MIHNMKLYQSSFDKIANGSKKIGLYVNSWGNPKIRKAKTGNGN